jgi:predicted MFS family arabinose efflux permease
MTARPSGPFGLAGRTATVLALGSAQTLAWASSYYLPAMLATPMARDLGVDRPTVFAVFSMALMVSAFTGPAAGRLIDRLGGRRVLMGSSALFVLGLTGLGLAQNLMGLVLAWAVLGVAMGCGLYDAAFAALVRLYGRDSRQAITGITLLAGFASTVGWPLTTLLEAHWGWRGACWAWAALHGLIGVPLNALLPRARPHEVAAMIATTATSPAQAAAADTPPPYTGALLALLFAMLGFVSTAMAAHLPALLQAAGATLAVAVLAGALIGPAQVAARVLEFSLLRRYSALVAARAASLTHPLGALCVLALGPVAALPFAALHGSGNGLLTIVRGTLPLALFGARGYGARQGWIALPGRILGGLSPWLFGLALERFGARALWLSSAMCLTAFACLTALRLKPESGPRP